MAHPGDHDVLVFFCLLPGTHLAWVCMIVEGEEMEVQTFTMSRILGSLPVCLLRSLAPCRWSTPWNSITFVLLWFDQKWCCWELGWNQCTRQWGIYIVAKPTCNIGPYTTVVLALDLRLCPELSLMIFKLICNVQEGSLDNFLSRYKNPLLVAIMCDWTC